MPSGTEGASGTALVEAAVDRLAAVPESAEILVATSGILSVLASRGADLTAAPENVADLWTMNPACALWAPPALQRLARRIEEGDNRLYLSPDAPACGSSRLRRPGSETPKTSC